MTGLNTAKPDSSRDNDVSEDKYGSADYRNNDYVIDDIDNVFSHVHNENDDDNQVDYDYVHAHCRNDYDNDEYDKDAN